MVIPKRIKVVGKHPGVFGFEPDLTVGREYEVFALTIGGDQQWIAEIIDDTDYRIFVTNVNCAHGGIYEVVA